jgi:ribosomal protein S18 acetylase RimI-like enzyme
MKAASDAIQRRATLNTDDLSAIRALADNCNAAEGLALKLNWDLMTAREPGQTNDFLVFHDDELIGYAALDSFGSEAELTGMVRPDQRRRGLGRALLDAAVAECQRRDVAQLLLVCEHASPSGSVFAQALSPPLRYDFSEYRLEWDAASSARPPAPRAVPLRQASVADLDLLARLQADSFDEPLPEAREQQARHLAEAGSHVFVGEVEGVPIGIVGVIPEEHGVYIRGLGVPPAQRGRGYGRGLLAAALLGALSEGHTHAALDVATENRNALGLYLSCGFRETNRYDYYDVALHEAGT